MLTIQPGFAQHCTPGFHFTVDEYTVVFDDQSTADGDITTYSWDFGNGQSSDEQNPTHTYSTSGTYNVCLTITAHNPGCTATFCHHVVIHDPPPGNCHAAFTAHQPDPEEQIIDFTDQSTSDGTIGSWLWNFGDGNTSTEQNPSHTYTEPGTYVVCLTVTDDTGECTSHVCHQVTVHHPPPGNCHALYNVHQADPDILTFDFTDQSTSDGAIGSWSWNFGDGNTSAEQNPTHTYSAPGTYLVCLTIIDNDEGCSSHFCHELIVHHPEGVCHASFTAHQIDPGEQGILFTDYSTSDGIITSWLWDFGDGNSSTEQNPSHTYQDAGTYLVCLYITDDSGCSSHFCHHVVVNHPPAAVCQSLFTVQQSDQNELTVIFSDLSTSDGTIGSWLWEFGDGITSTEPNPTHTYGHAGTYLVCLFTTDDDGGCTSHYCHHITLHHFPTSGHNSIQGFAIDDSRFRFKIHPPTSLKFTALNPLPFLHQSKMNGVDDHGGQPYILLYPNPVVGAATIQYDLAEDADVTIEIYNFLGQMVLQTINTGEEQGLKNRMLNTDELPSGTYIIRVIVDGEMFTKRIVVAK